MTRNGSATFSQVVRWSSSRKSWKTMPILRLSAERPLAASGQNVAVTCSAGVDGLRAPDASDGGELVARADAALKAAKRAGRNRALQAEVPRAEAPAVIGRLAVKAC